MADCLPPAMTSSHEEDGKKPEIAENTRKRKRLSAVLDKLATQVERRSFEEVPDSPQETLAAETEPSGSSHAEPSWAKIRAPPQKQLSVDSDISLCIQAKLGLEESQLVHKGMPPTAIAEPFPRQKSPHPPPTPELPSPVDGMFQFDSSSGSRVSPFRRLSVDKAEEPRGGADRSPAEGPTGIFTPPTSDSASVAGGSRAGSDTPCEEEREQSLSPAPEEEDDVSDDPFTSEPCRGGPRLTSAGSQPSSSVEVLLHPRPPPPIESTPVVMGNGASSTKLSQLSSSFPAFPICDCHHCRTLAGRAGIGLTWDELTHQRALLQSMKAMSASPASPLTPVSPVTPSFDTFLQAKFLPELYRRRSHSDSDLHHWLEVAADHHPTMPPPQSGATTPRPSDTQLQEPVHGLVMRHGRPVPKPLRIPVVQKGGSLESDQSTPQDSPLDLSVKSGSPKPLDRQFAALLSDPSPVPLSPLTFNNQERDGSPRMLSPFDLLAPGGGGNVRTLMVPKVDSSHRYGVRGVAESPLARYNLDVSPVVEVVSPGSDVAYVCPICGQMFSLHDRLAKHMASRHRSRHSDATGGAAAKSYMCEVCKRSFARSDMLTRHMRLHTGIKPYTCRVCGQVFSRSDHLSTHQRTHTGEKPYKCPQCPYAACRRDMITRHMRTHARYELPDSSSSFEDVSESPRDKLPPGGDERQSISPTHRLSALTVRSPAAPSDDSPGKE